MPVHTIFRFYAELDDYEPKIWRRFEVAGNKTIAELGYILMTMFEMRASHLFCLTHDFGAVFIDDLRNRFSAEEMKRILSEKDIAVFNKVWRFELPFEDENPNDSVRIFNASKYRLNYITDEVGFKFVLEYDYGDGWQVNLTLESCEKTEISASELPRVLEGEGYGIVEDCGGPGGLEQLAEAFKKKKGSQYEEYREWLGIDDLDLTAFDKEDMNFRLRKLPRIYKDIYERGYAPTQRSIDLIERRYKDNLSPG